MTTEVSNRQNNFASSALESKRPHFHAPLLTSLCKSALALVESTGLPRLKAIRVESFIFSFSCTLPIPGLANRLWLRSNRHSYYGSRRFESNRSHFHVPPLLSFPTFFHDVFASGRINTGTSNRVDLIVVSRIATGWSNRPNSSQIPKDKSHFDSV